MTILTAQLALDEPHAVRALAVHPGALVRRLEVGPRLRRFAVASESAGFGDLSDQCTGEIGALADDVEVRGGQLGALACVGGAPIALDAVAARQGRERAHVYSGVWGTLLALQEGGRYR